MMSGTETFTLSEEMKKKLDSLSGSMKGKFAFTSEQDYIIVNYYELKNKEELAELIGCDRGTLLRRFKELKKNVS